MLYIKYSNLVKEIAYFFDLKSTNISTPLSYLERQQVNREKLGKTIIKHRTLRMLLHRQKCSNLKNLFIVYVRYQSKNRTNSYRNIIEPRKIHSFWPKNLYAEEIANAYQQMQESLIIEDELIQQKYQKIQDIRLFTFKKEKRYTYNNELIPLRSFEKLKQQYNDSLKAVRGFSNRKIDNNWRLLKRVKEAKPLFIKDALQNLNFILQILYQSQFKENKSTQL